MQSGRTCVYSVCRHVCEIRASVIDQKVLNHGRTESESSLCNCESESSRCNHCESESIAADVNVNVCLRMNESLSVEFDKVTVGNRDF